MKHELASQAGLVGNASRSNLRLVACLLLVVGIAAAGLARFVERPGMWVQAQGTPTVDRKADVLAAVRQMKPGGVVPLTVLRTANGGDLKVVAVEGKFTDTSIEPPQNWTGQGWTSALLVNSVDDAESLSLGLSGAVLRGCLGGEPNLQSELRRGEAVIRPCAPEGSYASFGIKAIANLAIVTYKKVIDREPCFDPTIQVEAGATQTCVKDSVDDGLKNLFMKLRRTPERSRPDAIILPALGTGAGGLLKVAFYEVVQKRLMTELDAHDGFLPRTLILAVRQERNGQVSLPTAYGIGQVVEELEGYWSSKHPRASVAALWTLVGTFVGLSIACVIAIYRPQARLRQRETLLEQGLYTFGWLLAAFGASFAMVKLTEPFAAHLPVLGSGPLEVVYGLLGVILSGGLVAANDAYKANPSALPGQSS